MALDQAIVLAHQRMLEAGAHGDVVADVLFHVHTELPLQFGKGVRQLEQVIIERRARSGERQPVATHIGHLGVKLGGNEVEAARIGLTA